MTDQQIIDTYAAREMTILQMAWVSGRAYEEVRQVLVRAGYSYGLKVL